MSDIMESDNNLGAEKRISPLVEQFFFSGDFGGIAESGKKRRGVAGGGGSYGGSSGGSNTNRAAMLTDPRLDGDSYTESDRVVCDHCTTAFFQVYFKEMDQAQQQNSSSMTENDESEKQIMNDILSQKVYMNLDAKNKAFTCPQCGKVEVAENLLINQNDKRLKAAGIESYSEYHKITGSRGDFIRPIRERKKKGIPEDLLMLHESDNDYMNDSII